MADIARGAEEGLLPSPKRRKVRKGTQSCWECKRRKIRCTFVAPTEPVCDGCKSRQVKCISQEFHDEIAGSGRKRGRLDRMEALVAQLSLRLNADVEESLPGTRQTDDKNKPVSTLCQCPLHLSVGLYSNSQEARHEKRVRSAVAGTLCSVAGHA